MLIIYLLLWNSKKIFIWSWKREK